MKRARKARWMTILLVAGIVLLGAVSAWGTTYNVVPGQSIQTAIDAARPGDTIHVAAGVYEEVLDVSKPVTIQGAGPATYDASGNWTGGTLITRGTGGQASNQIVNITGDNVSMRDLSVDGRYGVDQSTGQTTHYGVFVLGQSVQLSNIDVVDSTDHGVELNNANGATLTNVTIKRTPFAPSYYNVFDCGLRVVDSENLFVDDLTVLNASRGIVVFQGKNSGTFKNVTIRGNGLSDSRGFAYYTSSVPGWWNPIWGNYEGNITFSYEGTNTVESVHYGIYISDDLTTKDISLSANGGASMAFSVVDVPMYREGEGSVPNLDTFAQAMGFNAKVVGFDPTNFPNGEAFFATFSAGKTWGLSENANVAVFDFGSSSWKVETPLKIQPAVDAAISGDTVNITAGTYNETVTVSKDAVTISGDPTSRPAITGGLSISAGISSPTLENLVISGNGGSNSVVRMSGTTTDLTLTNCVFNGGNVSGRHGLSGGQLEGDVTITNCEFKNILGWALLSSRSGSGGDGSAMGTVTFANNYIHDSNGVVALRGLSTHPTNSVDIHGNVWKNLNSLAPLGWGAWAALEVNRAQGVNIYYNDVSNVAENSWGEGEAFQLWAIGTLDLNHNNILNNFLGIWIPGGGVHASGDVSDWLLNYNSIVGNSGYGLKVDDAGNTGVMNATLNWWGSATGPDITSNTGSDGTGDAIIDPGSHVAYSPWLGITPDGDPVAPGVQITGPMTIIVAPVGPKPTTGKGNTGYLDAGIQGSNDLPYTDTIEVKHGTYDASEPITQGVNIVSQVGSAKHTTLNGNMSINSNNVLVGLPLRGFRVNGNVTVGAGNDAGTSAIHWSDLYGNVTNNGTGTFNAQYNYWGTQLASVIDGRTTGLVDYDPFLPRNADDSYTDIQALMAAGVAAGIDPAIDQLWLMVQLGQDVNTFIQYQGVAGAGAFAGAPAGATINLGGAAGGGGAVEGTISGTYTPGEPIEGRFTLTDPITGQPVTDAAVTTSLLGPDGALVSWGCATYDETTGEYVFSIDTSGLSPGTYQLIIQTDDGQSKTVSIEVQAA